MTLAYWCVLVAAYLPIVWTGIAKFGAGGRDFDNAAPRVMLAKLDGWRQRANWAQLNGFEAFPPFAAAVIIAHLTSVPQPRIDALALAFIAARIVYGVFYLMNLATLRSVAWMAATGCVVALFVSAA
ncbi:MAPEG family protein [Nevskia sp.]|uniref:MAPEG family protein n=1 Tax=Nevskia sp. TaxID=1929292 RepID=UPI0025CCCF0A|nr:MAPEG family protein [Nevskia sp.]HET7798118.1 MAPEG family protein [Nevskia sp.]